MLLLHTRRRPPNLSQNKIFDPGPAETGHAGLKYTLQALGLIFLVVVVNLALYILIYRNNELFGNSIFPPLVLFLSFSLSIAVILNKFLGDYVNVAGVHNPWITKIGVNASFVVVAVLITVFTGLGPFSKDIIPVYSQQFMLVNVGLRCLASVDNVDRVHATQPTSQAAGLMAVIWADQPDYITQVKKLLNDQSFMRSATQHNFTLVTAEDKYDKMLADYAGSQQAGAAAMQHDLRARRNWVAYVVRVDDPGRETAIPIPTTMGKTHTTRLFVILTGKSTILNSSASASLKDLNDAVAPANAPTDRYIVPLLEAQIEPNSLLNAPEEDLSLLVFEYPDRARECWNITPG